MAGDAKHIYQFLKRTTGNRAETAAAGFFGARPPPPLQCKISSNFFQQRRPNKNYLLACCQKRGSVPISALMDLFGSIVKY